ncbi:MAG: AMP-binding protein [Treponema sp.]|jgi:long-chain acyl-CoA synthetase|nr:AMP-binding protein [Treponema sp.]
MIKLTSLTLAELCVQASAKYKDRPAFELFQSGGIRGQVSYSLLGIRARQIASLLGRLGINAGDRVLILAENRPEWPLAYFGISLAGAVSVPVLTGFSSDQIRYIIRHADVSAVCLSGAMAAKIENLGPAVPLIFIDSIIGAPSGDPVITVSIRGGVQAVPLQDPADSRLPHRGADDPASIVYTSGTLGYSKGVMLSNRNLVSCARASRFLVPIHPRDRLLSVLPLAHTYECTLGLLAAVMSGAKISYLDRPPSPSVLLPAAQALRPTCMITVPLLIEKIYRLHIAPVLKASRLYRNPLTRPLALSFAGRRLNTVLGGSIRFFGIGGAPLAPEVEDFLRKARFPYSPGYGLTETAPLVAGTAPYRFPLRSAGGLLRGIQVRISAEDGSSTGEGIGEIQVRGPNVMLGYFKDEEQTRRAFTDGWFRTGDLGRLDKKGRLYIKGRLKALILGPAGENIYPEEIEGVLNASQMVEDALVYPGEHGELVALVRLSESARAAAQTATEAAHAVKEALEDLRYWANRRLAAFSRLSRIEARTAPFEKTPTLKIKRYLYAAPLPLRAPPQ